MTHFKPTTLAIMIAAALLGAGHAPESPAAQLMLASAEISSWATRLAPFERHLLTPPDTEEEEAGATSEPAVTMRSESVAVERHFSPHFFPADAGPEQSLAARLRADLLSNAVRFDHASWIAGERLFSAGIAMQVMPAPRPAFITDLDEPDERPNLSGRLAFTSGADRLTLPYYRETVSFGEAGLRRLEGIGVEWRRYLAPGQSFQLSASHGDSAYLAPSTRESVSSLAQVSWISELGWASRPVLTGSFFLGDESSRDRSMLWSGRKFYGVSLDGRLTVLGNHTPFASLRFQRSDYDGFQAGPGYMVPAGTITVLGVTVPYAGAISPLADRREDYSQLSAGWNWQIRPNWGLQAEAAYLLNNSSLPNYNYDRTLLYFSTRFDFR